MQYQPTMITSFDENEVAVSRIFKFIKDFAAQTLLVDCFSLSVRKDVPTPDKAKINKNNWKNKNTFKSSAITVYNYSFNVKKTTVKKMSLFYKKYNDYNKSIQGQVYYQDGNILRIVVSCYGEKDDLLNFIKYHPESYSMIDRYYRLSLVAMHDVHPKNKSISGRVECSYKVKKDQCKLEYVLSDEKTSQITNSQGLTIIQGLTSQGGSISLSNLLSAFVGNRTNSYSKFMIRYENESFQSLTSTRLVELQQSFVDFPLLSDFIRSDNFDDYVLVLEMEQI